MPGRHLTHNKCLKYPPMTPSQPIGGPWRRGPLGPTGKHLIEGLLRLSSGRIGVPLPTRWLSVRISYWREGVRSKQKRPTGEECVREKRWVCYSGNRERERLQRRGREATSPGFITAHCQGEEIAFQRRMLTQVKKWTVEEATEWDPRFTNGLLKRAQWVVKAVPAWQGTDTGEEADAVGKVTNYGDDLLTESFQTVRTTQRHFLKLDDIIDESQCTCPSGEILVPPWTITSSVA